VDGQPFEPRGGEVVENEIRAVGENFETNGSDESESAETHAVCNVIEVDDASSTHPELKRIIVENLGHLVKAVRKALAQVRNIMIYFYMTFPGHYRAQQKAIMRLEREKLYPLRRTLIKYLSF